MAKIERLLDNSPVLQRSIALRNPYVDPLSYVQIELLRRLRAAPAEPAAAETPIAGMTPIGACKLDLDAHRLYDADGREVPITSMEFDLLKAFVEHPNRVLSRDQLLDLAHNKDWEPFDRSIDIRIARLRRKIEADPSKPQVVKTVRGAGYIFVPKA